MTNSLRMLALGVMLHSTLAMAGSDTRDCETADKRVVMSGGNGSNRVQIKVIDSNGKPAVHDAPAMIMPHYNYNTDRTADDLVIAVPIASEKVVSKQHQTLHVKHKDGTSCTGRDRWDDRSVQSYVLMAKDGDALTSLLSGETIKGLTSDGYLVVELRCHTYGISSPGGCFVGEDDEATWK